MVKRVVVSRAARPTPVLEDEAAVVDGKLHLEHAVPVLSEGDEAFIFMAQRDVEEQNWHGKAQAYTTATGQYGPVQDLQVFFKWFSDLQPTTPAEFDKAIAAQPGA